MPYPVQAYVALVDANGNALQATSPLVLPGGRITPTTATPVLSSAASAVASVFYTPYLNNYIPIWNGTVWVPTTFSELTNTLANSAVGNAGPAAGAASKNYDLFVWSSGGTLYLTRGAAWNSDTARSATTENDLQRIQGVLCNFNAITNGPAAGYGTYVGTIRTDSGGATVTVTFATTGAGGSLGSMGVWNMYNRVEHRVLVASTTASYTYSSSTIRAAEASNAMRVNVIRGLNEQPIYAKYHCTQTLAAVSGTFGLIGVGLDVTNAISGSRGQLNSQAAVAVSGTPSSFYDNYPGLGFHFLQAVEGADNTNNVTFAPNGNENTGALVVKHWC